MSASATRFIQHRAAHSVAWIALGFAAASLLSIDAQAGAYQVPPQKTVGYADLNLSMPADANILYSRLQKAAKRVCGPVESRELRMLRTQRECYQEALASAVAKVNHAAITALYKADKSIRLAQQRGESPPRS